MLKKKVFIIVIVSIIMLICFFIGSVTINREVINKNIKLASIKNEDIDLLTYEIKDWNNPDDIKLLIKVTTENGLEYVKVPDENVISAQENNVLYMDFSIKLNEEKTFVIKEKEKDEKEEIILITEDDLLSKINYEPFVYVSNVTTTGYDLSYTLADKVKPYVDSLKYYLGTSLTDESPIVNTTGVVTGLSDYTKKYVWAEVTYKCGSATKTVKSENYRIVYTAHTHNTSCYNTNVQAYTYYDAVWSGDSYKIGLDWGSWLCCGTKSDYKRFGWIYYGTHNKGSYTVCRRHKTCGSIDRFGFYPDSETTAKEYSVKAKVCNNCGQQWFDYSTTGLAVHDDICCHITQTSVLICTKSTLGSSVSYYY